MQPKTHQAITLSNKALTKYTFISLLFALFVLVIVILPAEYNIDPSGIGHTLGFTVFHEVKVTTLEANTLQNTVQNTVKHSVLRSEIIEVTVPANRGVEYKFKMTKYQKLNYEWITASNALYFDLHGEPEGDTTGYFESYVIAKVNEMQGSFTTPFSGSHGWYWKNETDEPVVIKLIVRGEFTEHGLKK